MSHCLINVSLYHCITHPMYHSARRKKRPTARIVINYGSPLYEPWRKECHDKKPNNTQYSYTLVKICKHLQIDFKAFKHAVQAFKYHCHKHVKTFVSVLKSGNFHEDEVCQAGREKVVKTIMTRWGKKKTVAAPTCTVSLMSHCLIDVSLSH